ncbi:MAG: putative glutamine/gamma-aminobutyrate antiporter GadC [Microbacterium sp.]|uniref:putative glutamine/gamma-aminobutyrate antiporter GadC n=1 Tax=Microbacterium sp. TaxID=51671 RepID=UPI003A898FA8
MKVGGISIFGLALLNVTAVASLNNLPAEAEYGLSSIFYYVVAAIFFLVPIALVAAELATGWPEKGGIFRWVGEAFKGRIGFMVMFIAWVEVCVFIPTALTFGAVSLAFINPDEKEAEALSGNNIFVIMIVLVVYALATIITLFGSKGFATMAKWGGVIGVFIPMAVLFLGAIAYAASGHAPEMDVSWGAVIPDFAGFGTIVLALGITQMYAGMEMNAVHIKEVKNPTRNYPIAIFISAGLTVLIFALGTLSIAWVMPKKDINLTQAILVTYYDIFDWMGIPWGGSIAAIMLAVGVLVTVTTWVAGPSTGLLAGAKGGYLPPSWQKTNKHGAPVLILGVQAAIIVVLAILFVILPSVQAAYQILQQLATILYITIYILMFSAVIRLRYSQPDRPRPFRLGKKGNGFLWVVAGVGFLVAAFTFFVEFVPPNQIDVGSPVLYTVLLIVAVLVVYAIPNIIYQFRKPSWKSNDPDYAPFTWEQKTDAAATPVAAASADTAQEE